MASPISKGALHFSSVIIALFCLLFSSRSPQLCSRGNAVVSSSRNYISFPVALAASLDDVNTDIDTQATIGEGGEAADITTTTSTTTSTSTTADEDGGGEEAEKEGEEWQWEEGELVDAFTTVTENLKAQDAVWTLSGGNISDALQRSPAAVVMVYVHASWCGYCKDLTPEYRYAALLLLAMKAPVRLAMLDGPSNRDWVQANADVVKGYPSLLVFRNGAYVTTYKGHYSYRAIASFLLSKLGNLVYHVESPKDVADALVSATIAGASVDEVAATVPDVGSGGHKRDEVRGGMASLARRTAVSGHEVRLLGLCFPTALLERKEGAADGDGETSGANSGDITTRLVNNLKLCPGMLDFFEAAEQRAVGTLSVRSLQTIAEALEAAANVAPGRRPRPDASQYVPDNGRVTYFGGRDREPVSFNLPIEKSGMFFTPMWSDNRAVFELFEEEIRSAWNSASALPVDSDHTFVILALRPGEGSSKPFVASVMIPPFTTEEVLRFEASFHAPVIVRYENANLPHIQAFANGIQVLVFSPGQPDNDVYSLEYVPRPIRRKDETIVDVDTEASKNSRAADGGVWPSVGSSFLQVVSQVAQEYRGKAVFIHVPTTEYHLYRMFDMPNPSDESFVPRIMILNLTDPGVMAKYVMDSKPISDAVEDLALIRRKSDVPQWRIIFFREQLQAFMNNFYLGKLNPSQMSETIESNAANEEEYVKRLTAKTFKAAVEERGVSLYLVALVAPWCGHCKALEPVLNDMGKLFRAFSEYVSDRPDFDSISESAKKAATHVHIGRVDVTRNEVLYPGVRVLGFPTIYAIVHDRSNFDESFDVIGVESPPPLVKEYLGPRDFGNISSFILKSLIHYME